ncbi:hypothetical protein, partial [Salmonella enterica]|uniref:hypothetical protein n=1 Tax=Salmonella enterica TaxID=28901 RepID=UPI00352C2136
PIYRAKIRQCCPEQHRAKIKQCCRGNREQKLGSVARSNIEQKLNSVARGNREQKLTSVGSANREQKLCCVSSMEGCGTEFPETSDDKPSKSGISRKCPERMLYPPALPDPVCFRESWCHIKELFFAHFSVPRIWFSVVPSALRPDDLTLSLIVIRS